MFATQTVARIAGFFTTRQRLQHSDWPCGVDTYRQSFGAYDLGPTIGRGGMGEVFVARHKKTGKKYALKRIRRERTCDRKAIARFNAEIAAICSLRHPNIVRILDHGKSKEGIPYYAMELLEGMDLETMVNRVGPLGPARVISILRQVCAALSVAHARELVHRDIKPANIFVANTKSMVDGIKLLDFGLVESSRCDGQSPAMSCEGEFVGSPLYAPPESTRESGPADPRSDLYSLGATAYYLLTGRPVFTGDNPLRVIFAHAMALPTPPSELGIEIPHALEAILMKSLQKRPEDRFQSAQELSDALASVEIEAWTRSDARAWWNKHQEHDAARWANTDETAISQFADLTK
jgi:serine/threonine-protein kinase